jgi:hypothetical protein
MKAKQLLVAAVLGTSSLVGNFIVESPVAHAQSTTTGAVQGTVKEESNGESLVGVTIVASSSALQGTQTAITDENGFYRITNLPPGDYIITFYYADLEVRRSGVKVGVQKTTPVFQKLNTSGAGEKIDVVGTTPTIDPTSTSQGITLDQEYTRNIPIPGRTFDAALGAAAGSQGDALGVSFSGSSSLENQYYVDGVNTTGLGFGTVGSPVINDFIEEIEVITGGYNAEFGRSTGGVVNVVTKSGSNEFKGSVFGYITPGQLTAGRERTPTQVSFIDAEANLAYDADFGFEIGGPILKDKVWFYVGFAPAFVKTNIDRRIMRHTDCRIVLPNGELSECNRASLAMGGFRDDSPDIDPETGFYINDEVESKRYHSSSRAFNIVSKINFAVSPEHQGQISAIVQPAHADQQGVYGVPKLNEYVADSLTSDVSFKWTSKFNDNKTEVEAVVGWHRGSGSGGNRDEMMNLERGQVLLGGNLGEWGNYPADDNDGRGESAAAIDACDDSLIACDDPAYDPGSGLPCDPYPGITNCPDDGVIGYSIGGPGSIGKTIEDRRSIKLSVTQRIKALGSHEIKAGGDIEDNLYRSDRLLSGGAFLTNYTNSYVYSQRWVQLAPDLDNDDIPDVDDPRFDNVCRETGNPDVYPCDYLGPYENDPDFDGESGTIIEGKTFNWSAYIRDSWQILPNLTLNAGIRYEEQRLRYADTLQGTTDALTGRDLGKNAMVIGNMWAPRLGLLYDWTKEGRSKIYSHWGRFYESIPLDINDRSFGGEVLFQQFFGAGGSNNQCGDVNDAIGGPDGNGCLDAVDGNGNPGNAIAGLGEGLFGSSGVLVAPGIKGQYLDEILAGVEYELMDDLKLGIALQHRTLGRVLEDVSTDGANTYIIANPGEWSEGEENKLRDELEQFVDDKNAIEPTCMSGLDPETLIECQRQVNELALFRGIRVFDKPSRDYNALQFTATRRFSKKLYMQASYTYSRSQGNFPGLYSPNNGQVDPNISSQYDLIELLANRNGPLPQDKPHYIKVDGYYTFDLKKLGELTVGARFRALSGTPRDALGAHYLYGPDESFVLPRGTIGRTDFEHGLDLHIGYGKDIGKGMNIEVFGDIFNIYNRQGTAAVDDTYAIGFRDNALNPISGGTYEDLVWAKAVDGDGNETSSPVIRNPNFGNTSARYRPLSVQLGARLTF